jgi:hypothetical protein
VFIHGVFFPASQMGVSPRTAASRRVGGTMLARLGSVLYWTGYLLAVLFVVAGCLFGASQPSAWPFAIAMIAMGVANWLIGWSFRYVLAGY